MEGHWGGIAASRISWFAGATRPSRCRLLRRCCAPGRSCTLRAAGAWDWNRNLRMSAGSGYKPFEYCNCCRRQCYLAVCWCMLAIWHSDGQGFYRLLKLLEWLPRCLHDPIAAGDSNDICRCKQKCAFGTFGEDTSTMRLWHQQERQV